MTGGFGGGGTFETVDYRVADGVARITLNRPDVLNAITHQMAEEVRRALAHAGSSDLRAVLITGAGRAFCAGADLGANWEPGDPIDMIPGFETLFNPLIMDLRTIPLPVVAAVNGPAIGFGAGIALAADIVLAADTAFFGTAAASAAILPDGGLTAVLPAVLGPARASAFVMLGERLPAAEALSFGLVSQVHPAAELAAAADTVVATIAGGPTRTFAAAKEAFNAQCYPRLAEQLACEARLQQSLTDTADFAEGTTAFRERRAPRFLGR
jgi:2-(1,2-epoxy-1,2-dihydrophenyl)acetyl-CoA isomerase